MKKRNLLYCSFLFFLLISCTNSKQPSKTADLVILNGNIATMDKTNPKAEAIAIKNSKILKVGTNEEVKAYISTNTKSIDANGNFVSPGLIEGHGHFSGLGKSLMKLNFLKTKNWAEIVEMVAQKAKTAGSGEWIEGRGWHQEKWDKIPDKQIHGYPYHHALSELTSDNPVILRHASGHSLFANKRAMEIAGINKETPNPKGGLIVRDASGEAIGVFEERAMDIIKEAHQEYLDKLNQKALEAKWLKGIRLAEQNCLENGITSFQDAGSLYTEIDRYTTLAEDNALNLRLWVMLRHPYDEMKDNMKGFPILNKGDYFFTCRAIKSQVDGALGAYGAWLLKPYNDKKNFIGQNTTTIGEVENIAELCIQNNMQLCVHAIGDRANREVLDIYENFYQKNPNKKDLRWRIEHAQHVNRADIPRFGKSGIIASMQGVHCTSDAPFVPKRLGEERSKHEAYAWRTFIDSGALIANGTDAPVEDVSPIDCFYASVTRKRKDNPDAFFPEQCMTREEALASYTINNAYAAFEEDIKGSITEGKLADITIFSQDLLTVANDKILDTEVLYTIVGGEVKYQK